MYQLLDRFHLKPSSEALNAFLQAVAKAKMFGRLQAWSDRIREGMGLTLKDALEPATIHAIILAHEKMKNFDGMVCSGGTIKKSPNFLCCYGGFKFNHILDNFAFWFRFLRRCHGHIAIYYIHDIVSEID